MFEIALLFPEPSDDFPRGFEIGGMRVSGDLGTAESKPSQSMMLVLSLTSLLDGVGKFLSTIRSRNYQFDPIKGSFFISFRRERDGQNSVRVDKQMIHFAKAEYIKSAIERSVRNLIGEQNLDSLMNAAEAGDFYDAWGRFQRLEVRG